MGDSDKGASTSFIGRKNEAFVEVIHTGGTNVSNRDRSIGRLEIDKVWYKNYSTLYYKTSHKILILLFLPFSFVYATL